MVRTVVCCVAVFNWEGCVAIDEDVVVIILLVAGDSEDKSCKLVLDIEMMSLSELVVASVEITSPCVDVLCVALAVGVV